MACRWCGCIVFGDEKFQFDHQCKFWNLSQASELVLFNRACIGCTRVSMKGLDLGEAEGWVLLAAAVAVGYVIYKAANVVSDTAASLVNTGQNIDANLGLTCFDQAVSNFLNTSPSQSP